MDQKLKELEEENMLAITRRLVHEYTLPQIFKLLFRKYVKFTTQYVYTNLISYANFYKYTTINATRVN